MMNSVDTGKEKMGKKKGFVDLLKLKCTYENFGKFPCFLPSINITNYDAMASLLPVCRQKR